LKQYSLVLLDDVHHLRSMRRQVYCLARACE
jgi:tRNA uridine 5-carbamoylmethylation protein Kti12